MKTRDKSICSKEYVLITPAYNEEAYIERTIRSVISQVLLPKKWVIVSDCSTDKTDNIASNYADRFPFIEFIRNNEIAKTEYGIAARKVAAINLGFKLIKDIGYEYYGNLDADISFSPDFYMKLIEKFESNQNLGLCGAFVDNVCKGKLFPCFDNSMIISGSIQFFRRNCWEDIGGYYPGAYEDSIAVAMARMKGWEAQSFSDIHAYHHKCVGLPGRGQLRAKFHVGKMEHIMGDHILYQIARCIGAVRSKPVFIGSIMRILGYCWSALKGNKIQAPFDVVDYNRNFQKKRLKQLMRTSFSI